MGNIKFKTDEIGNLRFIWIVIFVYKFYYHYSSSISFYVLFYIMDK